MSAERWADAQRLEGWAGEARVNLLRAAAVVAFYGQHLLNLYAFHDDLGFADPAQRGWFHAAVSAVVLGWALAVFVLYVCLSRRWVPPALKYVATFWDLALVTALLCLSPDGPRSALIFLYFAVLAASPLRLSLRLVQVTTFATWAAALLMLGYYVFVRVGADRYYAAGSPYRVARGSEIIFLLATGVCGLFAGQVVRQARRLVEGAPVTVRGKGDERAA
ncbi:MAG TPA: hypothetical protein VFE78_12390 [Gemmataceae bacterium]|jgi:hypothetical protein|nr:hypothetical protein [Gemmataceae bacterium]